jgi:hypothetical protein
MAGSWGCPHEIDGQCHKVTGHRCDPGMKGCVLFGRYVFASAEKNQRLMQKQARRSDDSATQSANPADKPRE